MLQIAVMPENLYYKNAAIGLFPGIERCDLPPSFILASVCSNRRCYKRLDHGLDSFLFISRWLALFSPKCLTCHAKGNQISKIGSLCVEFGYPVV